MKCYFCDGNIFDNRCIMCGRSDDILHELYVKKEQRKSHHNWHGYNPPMWKTRRRRREEKEIEKVTQRQLDRIVKKRFVVKKKGDKMKMQKIIRTPLQRTPLTVNCNDPIQLPVQKVLKRKE